MSNRAGTMWHAFHHMRVRAVAVTVCQMQDLYLNACC